MVRLLMIAAAMLLFVPQARAHSEGAPPPKADAATLPAGPSQTSRGMALVDSKGMTLYYFDRDNTGNKSNCDGKCAEAWIPFAAPAAAKPIGDFTVITRTDGSKMWAYRFRPLYTSHADKSPGDANGYDAANLWHVARPDF